METVGQPRASSGLICATHDACLLHDAGPNHVERPARLTAVFDGIMAAGITDAVSWVEAPLADRARLERVHPPALLENLDALAAAGGGRIDGDTFVSADSGAAALRAAGAGLELIDRLDRGEGSAGWTVIRPPGHHATSSVQMGFCLINNIAVAARSLTDRGERVAIVDIDAHHGNGTQDIFYGDPDVLFASLHQSPLYPFSGAPNEIGVGPGEGSTINIAVPAGTTGDAYRTGVAEVFAPAMAAFDPTWLLISAGFDGHRVDPITDLGLTSGDFADIVGDLMQFAPPGRRLLFLEGGYDLDALAASAGAVAAALVGESHRPETPTSGGPGADAVELARRIHAER